MSRAQIILPLEWCVHSGLAREKPQVTILGRMADSIITIQCQAVLSIQACERTVKKTSLCSTWVMFSLIVDTASFLSSLLWAAEHCFFSILTATSMVQRLGGLILHAFHKSELQTVDIFSTLSSSASFCSKDAFFFTQAKLMMQKSHRSVTGCPWKWQLAAECRRHHHLQNASRQRHYDWARRFWSGECCLHPHVSNYPLAIRYSQICLTVAFFGRERSTAGRYHPRPLVCEMDLNFRRDVLFLTLNTYSMVGLETWSPLSRHEDPLQLVNAANTQSFMQKASKCELKLLG